MTDRGASARATQGGCDRRWLGRVAIWLLLAAAVWYAWRGPVAAWSGFSDFALVYAQARVWVQGGNPYDHPTLLSAMESADVTAPASFERQRWPAIYPPTMHPLMAPLAAMPWAAAKTIWLLVNITATLLAIALVVRLAELRGPPAVLFAAGALVFAPLLSGIGKGQLALVSLVLALDAWSMTRDRRDGLLAGLLLGLGLALKPQIAGVIWLLLVWRGRWRCTLMAAATAAGIGAVGAAWLWFSDVPWLEALRANLADNAVGGSGDPTSVNPLRFQLINLHYLLAVLIGDDRAAIDWAVRIAAMVLVVPALILARKRDDRDADLLLLGVLAAVSLLAVYHRPYDAVLLYPAAAWSLAAAWRGHRLGIASLLVLTIFLLPGAALPHQLADGGFVSPAIVESRVWQAVVMPHQVWALLVLTLLWLAALTRSGASGQHDAGHELIS